MRLRLEQRKSRAPIATVKETNEKRMQTTILLEHIMLERSRALQRKILAARKCKKSFASTHLLDGLQEGLTSQMQFQGQARTTM